MSIITRMRRQKAVYWERGEVNQYGQFSFQVPVEIDCRWEDGTGEAPTPQTQGEVYSSRVYVDRIMNLGDALRYGELDSDTPDDPSEDSLAKIVRRFDQIPNLRATETLYIAFL